MDARHPVMEFFRSVNRAIMATHHPEEFLAPDDAPRRAALAALRGEVREISQRVGDRAAAVGGRFETLRLTTVSLKGEPLAYHVPHGGVPMDYRPGELKARLAEWLGAPNRNGEAYHAGYLGRHVTMRSTGNVPTIHYNAGAYHVEPDGRPVVTFDLNGLDRFHDHAAGWVLVHELVHVLTGKSDDELEEGLDFAFCEEHPKLVEAEGRRVAAAVAAHRGAFLERFDRVVSGLNGDGDWVRGFPHRAHAELGFPIAPEAARSFDARCPVCGEGVRCGAL